MNELHDQVMKWLALGERGMSSETMAFRFLGLERRAHDETEPADPDDLRRCLLLLQAVPTARLHMDKLRPVSEVWNRMVDRWDEMEKSFLAESGGTLRPPWGTSMPKTYELMQDIRGVSRRRGLHVEVR